MGAHLYVTQYYLPGILPMTIQPRKDTRRKERRKNESGQKAKASFPTQAIDVLIGEEGRTKERNRERTPYPATWTIWSPLTTRIDNTVGLF